MEASLGTWAASQAEHGLSAAALETIFRVQADLIIKEKGVYCCKVTWRMFVEIDEYPVPVMELFYISAALGYVGSPCHWLI
jgi:hypothetical protein